jgi:hypothetical protein
MMKREIIAAAAPLTLFAAAPLALFSGAVAAQTSSQARIEAFAKLPDWSGLWEPNFFVDEGIGQGLSSEGQQNARPIMTAVLPFTPEWQAEFDAVEKAHDAAVAADPDHPPAPPYPPCAPPPFIIGIGSPALYEWRVTPEEATLVNTIGNIRHIYTDGRAHPPQEELWPTSAGDSIGHWEGDTLVVDTVAIKPDIVLFNFLPIRMSDRLHFIERIRMVGHDEIQDELTIDDPVALTEPFTLTISYARVTDTDRMINEAECDQESDRNPIVNGRFTSITTR